MTFFDETRQQLVGLGISNEELDVRLSGSTATFPDGGHFRIEVPTMNSAKAAAGVVQSCLERGLVVNRLTETRGLFRHTATEIKEYLSIARENGIEMVMSVGPRATYDIGASVQTRDGARIGYRLRGAEQLVRAVEDVKRGSGLGVTSFVVYDEGLLSVLSRLRSQGAIDEQLKFKVSAHCGHANPASAQIMQSLGADSFNPVRDLTLPMLASIRQVLSIPIDVHLDNPASSGGFVRNFEAPDIVRCCSPVHLKVGNGALSEHGVTPDASQLSQITDQVEIVLELLQSHSPRAVQSKPPNARPQTREPGLTG